MNEEMTFYIDGYLKSNLEKARELIKKDWDMIFVIDGQEGVGKSVLAQQIAYFCDPTLCLDRIVFTPDEFRNAVTKSEKFQAVVYDEAYSGLSSRGTMGAVNRAIVDMLTQIRQKNLFIIIVLPCYFDLDRYIALWRSRALIHCYKDDNWERGFFSFYNVDKKKIMYLLGKKMYDYKVTTPDFYGRFYGKYMVDKELYKEKKLKALEDKGNPEKQKESEESKLKELLFNKVMKLDTLRTDKQRWEFLGVSESTYYRQLKNWRLNNKIDDNEGDSLGF